MSNLKMIRLVLSGALLGVSFANGFLGVDLTGEILAGAIGAGGAVVLMKAAALV